jgi:MFS family permease
MSFRSREGGLPGSVYAIAAGRALSFLGDEVALLAMAFRAKAELGHFGVAAILIAGTVPLLALAPVSGLVVDRVRARPLILLVSLAQAAICVALAWSSSATLVPLVFLLACGTAVATPAWQALVPTLVTNEQLPGAMGMLQSASAAAGVLGPFVGGLLVGTLGFHAPLLLDGATFAVLAFVPVVLRVDRRPEGATKAATRSEAFAGFSVLLRDRLLRAIMVLVTFFVLALCVINVVELWYVTQTLHAGPVGYGLLGACAAVGMLAVGAASGAIAKRFPRPERLFLVGCAGLSVFIAGFGLVSSMWLAACLLLLVGGANALTNVNAMVILTRATTDEVRGRVFAATQGTISAAQITAMAIGGLLLVAFPNGARPIILLGAAGSVLALVATAAPVVRAGRVPARAPTAALGGEVEPVAA